jgi:glycosyltransferase involved in cell wall biosynthesis
LPLPSLLPWRRSWPRAERGREAGFENIVMNRYSGTECKSAADHSSLITHHSSPLTHHSPRPIRVVRIIDRLNIGGPAKHVVWLTAELRKNGFETTLITGTVPHGEGDMAYFAREAGVEPVVIKEMSRELSPLDVVVIAKLLWKLWQLEPDIIHTHKAKAGAAGRLASMLYKWLTLSALWLRPRRCRIVHTYHGHIFHGYYGTAKTRLFLAIERAMARFCTDRIIAISPQQRSEINGVYKIGRAAQYKVIPLGIDLGEAGAQQSSLREEFGIGSEDLVVGIVGRLCEVKNHAMFLRAAARIKDEGGRGIHFVVVGDGPLRQQLESLACDLELGDSVRFAGFRRDALALYSDMDLVALTSVNEGTPLTLIEAMSCGRPVVATEVGGVVDIMGARRAALEGFCVWDNGITVASGDVAAFARALAFAAGKPKLRREMGERGKRFVSAALSKDRLVDDVEALYRELYQERQDEAYELRLQDESARAPRLKSVS